MATSNTEITVPLSPLEESDADLAAAIAAEQEDEVRRVEELQRQQPQIEEIDVIDAKYSLDHLAAVVRPVMITMVLASLAVMYVRDQSSGVSSGLSSYLVYSDSSTATGGGGGGSSGGGGSGGGSSPTGSDISNALINALVIVAVVCGATFVLVACYYFRCLKIMLGYLMLAMTMLLGYTGTFLVSTALTVWEVPADWVTLAFIMGNFAVVGVWSVFYQKGVPRAMAQAYLVCVSVIMAWVLTQLPEWTSWALLVVLALYDLCAVLTPCGPLRALVALAQERRDPIPGLLYEANVGGGEGGVRDTFVTGEGRAATAAPAAPQTSAQPRQSSIAPMESLPVPVSVPPPTVSRGSSKRLAGEGGGHGSGRDMAPVKVPAGASSPPKSSATSVSVIFNPAHSPPAPVVPGGEGAEYTPLPTRSASADGASTTAVGAAAEVREWGASASRESVGSGSGRPLPAAHADVPPHQEEEEGTGEEEMEEMGGSIKLGLGDFVFYSVLVSRAAMYDASTLAACLVAVIAGLGGTLFLLSLLRKALPALPISIGLGVLVYLATRFAVTPMLEQLVLNP